MRLQSAKVRAVHCLILRGERHTIVRRIATDTRLNGRGFTDAPLSAGDRLSIGPHDFEIVAGEDLGETAALPSDREHGESQASDSPAAGGDDHNPESSHPAEAQSRSEPAVPVIRRRARKLICHAKNLRGQLNDLALAHQQTLEEIAGLRQAIEEATSRGERADRLEEQLVVQEAQLDALNEKLARVTPVDEQEDNRLRESLQSERESLEQQRLAWEEDQRTRLAEIAEHERQIELDRARLETEQRAVKACHDDWRAEREEAKCEMLRNAELSQGLKQQLDELRESLDHDRSQREIGRREQASEVEQRLARLELACSTLERERQVLGKTLREEQSQPKQRVQQLDGPRADAKPSGDLSSFEDPSDQHSRPEETLAKQAAPVTSKSPAAQDDGPTEQTEFESISEKPPVSASEILERLGTQPAETEDRETDLRSASTSVGAVSDPPDEPQVVEDAAARRTSTPAASQASKTNATSDDESIEDYMNQLLARTRGDSRAAPPAKSPPPPAIASTPPVPAAENDSSKPEKKDGTTETEEPAPRKPKRRPPSTELTSDLPAMRELAKIAAQSALDQHARVEQRRSLQIQTTIFILMFAGGLALLARSESLSWPFWGGVLSVLTSVLWGLYRGTLYLKGRRDPSSADRQIVDAQSPPAGGSIADQVEVQPRPTDGKRIETNVEGPSASDDPAMTPESHQGVETAAVEPADSA